MTLAAASAAASTTSRLLPAPATRHTPAAPFGAFFDTLSWAATTPVPHIVPKDNPDPDPNAVDLDAPPTAPALRRLLAALRSRLPVAYGEVRTSFDSPPTLYVGFSSPSPPPLLFEKPFSCEEFSVSFVSSPHFYKRYERQLLRLYDAPPDFSPSLFVSLLPPAFASVEASFITFPRAPRMIMVLLSQEAAADHARAARFLVHGDVAYPVAPPLGPFNIWAQSHSFIYAGFSPALSPDVFATLASNLGAYGWRRPIRQGRPASFVLLRFAAPVAHSDYAAVLLDPSHSFVAPDSPLACWRCGFFGAHDCAAYTRKRARSGLSRPLTESALSFCFSSRAPSSLPSRPSSSFMSSRAQALSNINYFSSSSSAVDPTDYTNNNELPVLPIAQGNMDMILPSDSASRRPSRQSSRAGSPHPYALRTDVVNLSERLDELTRVLSAFLADDRTPGRHSRRHRSRSPGTSTPYSSSSSSVPLASCFATPVPRSRASTRNTSRSSRVSFLLEDDSSSAPLSSSSFSSTNSSRLVATPSKLHHDQFETHNNIDTPMAVAAFHPDLQQIDKNNMPVSGRNTPTPSSPTFATPVARPAPRPLLMAAARAVANWYAPSPTTPHPHALPAASVDQTPRPGDVQVHQSTSSPPSTDNTPLPSGVQQHTMSQ